MVCQIFPKVPNQKPNTHLAEMSDTKSNNSKIHFNKHVEDKYEGRLAKRLCYILRYGAIKEGLTVHEGGYIDIKELMSVHMMRHHSEQEVLEEIDTSLSHRNTKRFERKDEHNKVFVRALFCRNFEQSAYHEGTSVTTLLQTCMTYVSNNLQEYDLEDFPDEFILSTMISQLKKKKKLNSSNLRQLLVPALEHLDFDSVYLTQSILKTMYINCPHLKFLSMKDCGYIVTDIVVEQILRKLPKLESLNLCSCKHVTDKGIASMIKYGKNLTQLNLSWIKTISSHALLDLVVNCARLKHLDIYDHMISSDIKDVLIEAARQRDITLVLKGLQNTDPDVTLENPSSMLPNFGKTW